MGKISYQTCTLMDKVPSVLWQNCLNSLANSCPICYNINQLCRFSRECAYLRISYDFQQPQIFAIISITWPHLIVDTDCLMAEESNKTLWIILITDNIISFHILLPSARSLTLFHSVRCTKHTQNRNELTYGHRNERY